jgi:acetyl esterase/lipase
MFYHGAGFCLGDLEMEKMNCRLFANEFGAVCVNVYYRLAPEHPFPTSINGSWDTFKWVSNLSNVGQLV